MERGPTRIGIAGRLRAARERRGLSREALAFHSGVSWSAIAQIESGRREQLRAGTLASLAKACDVTIDYLVSGGAANVEMLEHRLLLYETQQEFFDTATPYLTEALDRSEPVLAVTSPQCIRQLQRRLGARAKDVEFADRAEWYSTPAAALERYRAFLKQSLDGGAPWVRVLGEPVFDPSSDSDVRMWARYESLLNLVFSGSPVTVLCAYDSSELSPAVTEHARATHPDLVESNTLVRNDRYAEPGDLILGR